MSDRFSDTQVEKVAEAIWDKREVIKTDEERFAGEYYSPLWWRELQPDSALRENTLEEARAAINAFLDAGEPG